MIKIGIRDDGWPKSCEICAQIKFQTDCHECPNQRPAPDFSKYTAAKHDTGKPRPTLVPPSLIRAVAAIRGYGAMKYKSDDNWMSVEPQRYRDALYRHWLAYLEGEVDDPESGLPHLWHIATNVAFLIEMEGEQCD